MLSHVRRVIASEAHALVPLALSSLVDLKDTVFAWIGVACAESIQQVAQSSIDGDVDSFEAENKVWWKKPRRSITGLENVDLGVLRGEKVIIAWLAAHAASGICHISSRKGGVEHRRIGWGCTTRGPDSGPSITGRISSSKGWLAYAGEWEAIDRLLLTKKTTGRIELRRVEISKAI